MQTQPISPHAGPEYAMGGEERTHSEESPKKKTMMEKVKNKAKKLKTKIKKPKSPSTADNNDESSSVYSSEDETGSEPHQQVGEQAGEEKEEVVNPGPQGEAFEAIPDPHMSGATARTAVVEQSFGHMSLGDEPHSTKLQEEVPSAPGVTPYRASHNLGESPCVSEDGRGILGEEGENVEGKGPLVTPISTDFQGMDYEKTPEVSKTSDNTAASYTPSSEDKASEEEQQQKPLEDHVTEGVAATAPVGAGTLAVKSLSDDSENVESKGADAAGGKKSMLEQAKERIFGTSPTKTVEGKEEQLQTSESKPTVSERATSFKDTIVAKLGYGSNKNLTTEGDNSTAALQVDTHDRENKSVLSQGEGEEVGAGENKTYTQKAYDAAYGAKEAVTAKLGYGGTASTETPTTQGEQKSYLQGAKDAVSSKLGYANRELPASTEGAFNDEQNVPASMAARFHPGEEDRALSQLITEKLTTGAATVKDTLMRPFGASKSGPPTPTTAAVAEDPVHNTVTATRDVAEGGGPYATGEEKTGIVGKVTGAVTSLLGTSGSGKKRADEATGKANEDSQAPGVCNVETS